jgi:hypothetical protein
MFVSGIYYFIRYIVNYVTVNLLNVRKLGVPHSLNELGSRSLLVYAVVVNTNCSLFESS